MGHHQANRFLCSGASAEETAPFVASERSEHALKARVSMFGERQHENNVHYSVGTSVL